MATQPVAEFHIASKIAQRSQYVQDLPTNEYLHVHGKEGRWEKWRDGVYVVVYFLFLA